MRAINYSSVIEKNKLSSEQIKRHENYHWKKNDLFSKMYVRNLETGTIYGLYVRGARQTCQAQCGTQKPIFKKACSIGANLIMHLCPAV